MRVDALDVLDAARARQQVLVHAQLDLTADAYVGREEHVQRGLDRTLRGILHRHDAEIGIAGRHFLEHFLDRGQRQRAHRVAEVLQRGLLRVRAFRPEVANLQRLLLR